MALDARDLKLGQRAMSGNFHVGLQAELTERLGVSWGAKDYRYARTINGIDREVVDAMSTRTGQVDAAFDAKFNRFVDTNGHNPSEQQMYRMEREAALETRPAKDTEKREFDRWKTEIETVAGTDARTIWDAATTAARGKETEPPITVRSIKRQALAEVTESRSSFTRADLVAAIAKAQPVGAGAKSAKEAIDLIDAQADEVLEDIGIEVTPQGTDLPVRRFSTEGIIREELETLEHIDLATRAVVEPNPNVAEFAPAEIDPLQLHAAARAASQSGFEVSIGPAGTGKTTLIRTVVDTLRHENRHVAGLAPSAIAATELQEQTGMAAAENVSKFLFEHYHKDGGPSPEFQLPAGTTLIVDEAGMVSTPHWAKLTELADIHDWRIVAVGDPYQFSAVGRGGIFEHLHTAVPQHRVTHLEKVHRFANDWEATAAAKIRAGDTSGLDAYFNNDRIHTIEDDRIDAKDGAVGRYMRVRESGQEAALFASTNEAVEQLNHDVQDWRQFKDELGPQIPEDRIDQTLYIGDEIETRRNERDLTTDRGHYVKNRDRWTITSYDQHGVTVEGSSGTVTLPYDYVSEHVNLAYAQTAHASQGRTIDGVAITVISDGDMIDRAGLYVPLTRGKHGNELFLDAPDNDAARQILEDIIERRWVDTPAISHTTTPQTPLPQQTQTGRELLIEQPSLFDTDNLDMPTPEPAPVFPDASPEQLAAIRREDHPPQEPEPAPTPEPVPEPAPSSIEEEFDRFYEPDAEPLSVPEPTAVEIDPRVLDPVRVGHLVDRATFAESMIYHANETLPAEIAQLRSLTERLTEANRQRNSAQLELQEHDLQRPKMRGVKKWENERARIEHRLESATNRTADLHQQHTTAAHWVDHYKQWQTHGPGDLAHIRAALEADRQHLGQRLHDHPDITSKLGPAPDGGSALQAWQSTAGAIAQHGILVTQKPPLQVGGIDPSTGLKVVGSLQAGIGAPQRLPWNAPPPPGGIDPKTGFPTTNTISSTAAHKSFIQRDIKTGTADLAQQVPTVPQQPTPPGPQLGRGLGI